MSLINEKLFIIENAVNLISSKQSESRLLGFQILDGCLGAQNIVMQDIFDYCYDNFGDLLELGLYINEKTSVYSLLTKNSLNLEGKSIDVLPNIKNMHWLNKLYCSINKIKEIPDNFFKKLRNFECLHFDSNEIASINNQTFAYCYNVRELYLGNNKIAHISPTAFDDMVNLECISLHSNPCVADIKSDLFKNCTKLKVIYLTDQTGGNIPTNYAPLKQEFEENGVWVL